MRWVWNSIGNDIVINFKSREPTLNFVIMGKKVVSEIWIYPVKSMGGIALTSARVLRKGIEHDRRWMLIDQDNTFLTQRAHAAMALFKCVPVTDGLSITHGKESIPLPFTYLNSPIQATVWDDTVLVHEVSKELSQWVSVRLGIECRLVSFPEENSRPVDPRYAINDEQVSLSDGYPLLVIGQSSLDDINKRLKEAVPMNRFRPNIVFTGGEPFEEDGWSAFHIQDTVLTGVKPCARCVMTTVDQETAMKGKEPLATLATFRRKENNKIYVGQNLLVAKEGTINIGDEINFEE